MTMTTTKNPDWGRVCDVLALAGAAVYGHRVAGELLGEAMRQAGWGNGMLAREALRRALVALPDLVGGESTAHGRSLMLRAQDAMGSAAR